MSVYTTWFAPPGGDAERPPMLVRDGFSPWALIFGWLVLLRPGSWLCAALSALASIAATVLARHLTGGWALLAGLHLTVAAFSADWRCWELRLGGYRPGPIVSGVDRTHALRRLLDKSPELVGRPA